MPSKIQLDENLWFLYTCIQNSDLKTIDFAAVGLTCSIKAPAARMRFTRLKRQIESGTLIGTHGTPFSPSHGSVSVKGDGEKKESKRKRSQSEAKPPTLTPSKADGLSEETQNQNGNETVNTIKVKEEHYHGSSSSSLSSLHSEDGDSEDEIPLAKLRKLNTGTSTNPTEKIGEGPRPISISSSIAPSTPALHPAIITSRPPQSAPRGWVKIGTHFPSSPIPSSFSTQPSISSPSASQACTSTTINNELPKRHVPKPMLASMAAAQCRPYISPYACVTGPIPRGGPVASVGWHQRFGLSNGGGGGYGDGNGGNGGNGNGVEIKREFGRPYAPGAWGVLIGDGDA
ncbi:hypothetical protein B0J14DRAFT_644995 [Halenospora varia]|nr:hypothetical protein B0J14DRAFT_644995 [Halenospora varia]